MNEDNYAHSEGGYVTKSQKTPLYCIIAKVCQKCAYDMKHHSIVEIVRTLWIRSSFLGQDFQLFSETVLQSLVLNWWYRYPKMDGNALKV